MLKAPLALAVSVFWKLLDMVGFYDEGGREGSGFLTRPNPNHVKIKILVLFWSSFVFH